MKKFVLLGLMAFLFSSWQARAIDCPWTFVLADSYGDGWNGSTLIIKENGIAIDTITILNGSYASFQVPLTSGSNIQVFFTTGSYNSECSFTIFDNAGLLVYSTTPGLVPGQVYSFSSYCACAANASFSFLDQGLQVHFFAPEGMASPDYSLSWNFGDGSPAVLNDNDPVHTYSAAGSYAVSLSVIQAGDTLCADTFSNSLSLTNCAANAFFNAVDSLLSVDFTTFFAYDTTLWDIEWNFGDNLMGVGNPAEHVYASAGYYEVACTVTSVLDTTCFDTFTQTVQVGDCNMYANFSYWAQGFTANFYPNVPYGSQVLWNFGDGTTSTSYSTDHVYSAAGTYTVTLTVYSASNPYCYEIITQSVFVDGCLAQDLVFDYTILDYTITAQALLSAGMTGYSVNWNMGDGTIYTNMDSVSHTYSDIGNYQIEVTIQSLTDPNCNASTTTMIHIWGPCQVDGPVGFSFTDDMDLNFVFTADTVFTDPNIIYAWDFGDTFFSSAGYSVEHSFANPGVYEVTLYVGHPFIPGCVDSMTISVEAFQCQADAGFTYNVNPVNQMLYYFHTPHDYLFTEHSVLWDFGGGNTVSNNNDPSFNFPYPGLYPVSLEVQDLEHSVCHDFHADTLNLCNMNVDFSFTTEFLDLSASTLYDPSQYTIEWDFGDGQTASALQSVTHTYDQPGTYQMCITITHTLFPSCSFQTCHSVTVVPNGIGDLPWSGGKVSLYPNPAQRLLNVELENPGGEEIHYHMVSLTGQEFMQGHLSGFGLVKTTLDVQALPQGVYFLRFLNGSGQEYSMKFIR